MGTTRPSITILLAAAGLILLIEVSLMLRIIRMPLPYIEILGIVRLFEFTGMMAVVYRLGHPGMVGINRATAASGVKTGLWWAAGFGSAALMLGIVLKLWSIDPFKLIQTRLPENQVDIILYFIVGAVAAPAAEELFFRGIIFGFFRRWGKWVAVIVSTVLFVSAHTNTAALPLPQLTGGILFAMAYEKSGNLLTPYIIHALGNSAIFGLSLWSG